MYIQGSYIHTHTRTRTHTRICSVVYSIHSYLQLTYVLSNLTHTNLQLLYTRDIEYEYMVLVHDEHNLQPE